MKLFFYQFGKEKDLSYVNNLYNGFGSPVVVFANNIGISANVVTIGRGISAIISLTLFAYGYFILASIFLIVNQYLDSVDGDVARLSKKESKTGEYLEVLMDNPLTDMHGLLGFFVAIGVYAQTGNIVTYYLLFLIAYGTIMNNVFSSFSFHDTNDLREMKSSFSDGYNEIMKYHFAKRLYFTAMHLDEWILLTGAIAGQLLWSMVAICAIRQIRWISRVIIQVRILIKT